MIFSMFVLIFLMLPFFCDGPAEHGISFFIILIFYFVAGAHYSTVKSYCHYFGRFSVLAVPESLSSRMIILL